MYSEGRKTEKKRKFAGFRLRGSVAGCRVPASQICTVPHTSPSEGVCGPHCANGGPRKVGPRKGRKGGKLR